MTHNKKDPRLEAVEPMMEKAHQEHMDMLWKGQEERAERAFREYQRLLKEYNAGVLYIPNF